MFIKEEKLQDIRSSIQKVAELDLDDKLNHAAHTDIDLGIVTTAALKKLQASDLEKLEFRMSCKNFALGTARKILEKAPMKYSLVRSARSLDPKEIISKPVRAIDRMKELIQEILSYEW